MRSRQFFLRPRTTSVGVAVVSSTLGGILGGILAGIAGVAGLAGSASGAVYEVRPDGTGDAPTIQAAIDLAANGDVVELTDGTFSGPGNRAVSYLGKAITVRSQSGNAGACVIDLNIRRGFIFENGETNASVLEKVHITNGYSNQGGGIFADTGSPTIRSCIISSCNASEGGGGAGIYCRGSTLVTGCHLFDNGASEAAGAGIAASGNAIIEYCTMSENGADISLGVGIYSRGLAVVRNCVIEGNYGTFNADGAGVSCSDNSSLIDCVITGNSLDPGSAGAGVVCRSGSPSIVGCSIAANRAAGFGGGIYVFAGSSPRLERTIVWGNCASDGSAIFVDSGGSVTLSCCLVNPAEVEGPGVVVFENPAVNSDPLFCDPEPCGSAPTIEGDYTVSTDSPCLPANNPCGVLIGALSENCGAVPIDATSWGGLKARFR